MVGGSSASESVTQTETAQPLTCWAALHERNVNTILYLIISYCNYRIYGIHAWYYLTTCPDPVTWLRRHFTGPLSEHKKSSSWKQHLCSLPLFYLLSDHQTHSRHISIVQSLALRGLSIHSTTVPNNCHHSGTVGTVKGYQYIEVSTHVYKRKVLYIFHKTAQGAI